ncbi:2963_t:CDS:2, partial [Cetraspora pellucida]
EVIKSIVTKKTNTAVNQNKENPPNEESKNSDSEDIEKLSPIRTNNHGNRRGHGRPRLNNTASTSQQDSEVEPTQDIFLELLEYEESKIDELVIDLTENDPNIAQAIDTYREINNVQIPTEERLDDTQIIEIVIAKQLECKE